MARSIKKVKVFVAMSGGVDSSVAATLLKKQGYDVAGVFMKFWTITKEGVKENKCCSIESYHDALSVANELGIKLHTFNFETEFKKRVVDYFIKSLKQGITPNPCVMCNKEIKFKILLEKISKLGGDYVATGHYVKKSKIKNQKSKLHIKDKKIKNGRNYRLLKARDKTKDQSYFLWTIKQKQLAKFLFPVGGYTKPEVRKMAEDFGLPVSKKIDSEDLCFIGDDFGGFVEQYIKPKRGEIVDIKNNVLGKHKGLVLYTIGQRRDIGLAGGPWYVHRKDIKNNRLIVVHGEDKELLFSDKLVVGGWSWISGKSPNLPMDVTAKIRYQHKGAQAVISKEKNKYIVKFKKPQLSITLGQSVVFYKGEELLGGGVIR